MVTVNVLVKLRMTLRSFLQKVQPCQIQKNMGNCRYFTIQYPGVFYTMWEVFIFFIFLFYLAAQKLLVVICVSFFV